MYCATVWRVDEWPGARLGSLIVNYENERRLYGPGGGGGKEEGREEQGTLTHAIEPRHWVDTCECKEGRRKWQFLLIK